MRLKGRKKVDKHKMPTIQRGVGAIIFIDFKDGDEPISVRLTFPEEHYADKFHKYICELVRIANQEPQK
jgi:hypothetical protein